MAISILFCKLKSKYQLKEVIKTNDFREYCEIVFSQIKLSTFDLMKVNIFI